LLVEAFGFLTPGFVLDCSRADQQEEAESTNTVESVTSNEVKPELKTILTDVDRGAVLAYLNDTSKAELRDRALEVVIR
jgi:hypothetical protein